MGWSIDFIDDLFFATLYTHVQLAKQNCEEGFVTIEQYNIVWREETKQKPNKKKATFRAFVFSFHINQSINQLINTHVTSHTSHRHITHVTSHTYRHTCRTPHRTYGSK